MITGTVGKQFTGQNKMGADLVVPTINATKVEKTDASALNFILHFRVWPDPFRNKNACFSGLTLNALNAHGLKGFRCRCKITRPFEANEHYQGGWR